MEIESKLATCKECSKALPSLRVFTEPPQYDSDEHVAHGFLVGLSEMRHRTSCCLCTLIVKMADSGPFSKTRIADGSHTGWYFYVDQPSSQGGSSVTESSVPGENVLNYLNVHLSEYKTGADMVIFTIRLLSDHLRDYKYGARAINSSFIDYSLSKSWLNECESKHRTCEISRTALASLPEIDGTFTHMVDAKELCLVEHDLRKDERYLALSYVWGARPQPCHLKANTEALMQPMGLLQLKGGLPATIIDAIDFTVGIGERYLWIDSLCIIQNNATVKQRLIDSMDVIYNRAVAIIVAGSGDGAYSGIPGVGRERIPETVELEISEGTSLVAHASCQDHLKESLYRSRGWTFQEQQLARRSFVFVNNQVYFACRERCFSEEVVCEETPSADRMLAWRADEDRVPSPETQTFTHYMHSVSQYTTRALGRPEEDHMNAFKGILKVQMEQLRGGDIQKLFCLPAAFFDAALLWQPMHQIKSRLPQFPSWTWVGWMGQVMWYQDIVFDEVAHKPPSREKERSTITPWLKDKTWIDWHVIHRKGDLPRRVFVDNYETAAAPLSEAEINDFLGYPLEIRNGRLERTQQETLLRDRKDACTECDEIDIELTSLPAGCLVFETISVRFRIVRKDPQGDSNIRFNSGDPYPNERYGVITFVLQNRFSQPCGWVQLDETWKEHSGTDWEFLVLSEAPYEMQYSSVRPHSFPHHPYDQGGKLDPLTGEGWHEFHVMMVKNVNDGIKERIGLGRVMQDALPDGIGNGPRWKTIALC